MFKIDDFYICLDPFWRKSHRKHTLIASELYDTKTFLYIYFVHTIWTKNGLCRCEKTAERYMYVSVKCDFEWNFFQIQMTNSTNFENGHELSLIWISDRVNILCIFVNVHPSVWESVNAYRVSLAQWLKSTSNDMPEALTRARLPGGTT